MRFPCLLFKPSGLALPLLLSTSAFVYSKPLLTEIDLHGPLAIDVLTPKASGTAVELQKRADEACEDEVGEYMGTSDDGPTADGSAGIGVEFETASVYVKAVGTCSQAVWAASKGKVLGERVGVDWSLTADTTFFPGLSAEYIIDGTTVKIGSGDLQEAADGIAADFAAWKPVSPQRIDVEDSPCQWMISKPTTRLSPNEITWGPQVTVAMPLEGINDLISQAVGGQTSPLLPSYDIGINLVSVTRDFFQSKPGGIDPTTVQPDVLGFFSLIVSYAKVARSLEANLSFKSLISIMPRTEFHTVYGQVSSKLQGVNLYDVVKILACYQNGGKIDTDYCTGDPGSPVPNGKLDTQTFVLTSDCESFSLAVPDWIKSVANGPSLDLLTQIDKNIKRYRTLRKRINDKI